LAGRGLKLRQHSEKLNHDQYLAKLIAATAGGTLILLDQNGECGSTEWFVEQWKMWKISDTNTHLAIGPVDGFDKAAVAQHKTLGLGPLTMTYEMAAVVLIEQLYRASEVERGSPYHRD
jgi:23S rRNA (pseudouridine1915-N3)-methyltransferase